MTAIAGRAFVDIAGNAAFQTAPSHQQIAGGDRNITGGARAEGAGADDAAIQEAQMFPHAQADIPAMAYVQSVAADQAVFQGQRSHFQVHAPGCVPRPPVVGNNGGIAQSRLAAAQPHPAAAVAADSQTQRVVLIPLRVFNRQPPSRFSGKHAVDRHRASRIPHRRQDQIAALDEQQAVLNRDSSSTQRDLTAGGEGQATAFDANFSLVRPQKAKRFRRRHAQGADPWIGCAEHRAIAQAQFRGGADMYRAGHVQLGVFPEQHPGRIEQVQVCPRNGGAHHAVNERNVAAGDPTDDVVNRVRAAEGGTLAGVNRELAEAVEQITAQLPAKIRRDGVIWSGERPGSTQGAVHAHCRIKEGRIT